jgi:hypothetical protein
LETLADFLARTRKAQFEDFARQKAAVHDRAAFEEMKAHILRHYEGIKPVNSFYDRRHCLSRRAV